MHFFVLQFEQPAGSPGSGKTFNAVRTHIVMEPMTDHQIRLQMERDRTEAEAWCAAVRAQEQGMKNTFKWPPFT